MVPKSEVAGLNKQASKQASKKSTSNINSNNSRRFGCQ